MCGGLIPPHVHTYKLAHAASPPALAPYHGNVPGVAARWVDATLGKVDALPRVLTPGNWPQMLVSRSPCCRSWCLALVRAGDQKSMVEEGCQSGEDFIFGGMKARKSEFTVRLCKWIFFHAKP